MAVKTVTLSDGRTFKLGRIRPKARPAVLRLGAYIDESKVTPPPTTLDYYTKAMLAISQVLGNDREGDCTVASIIHMFGVATAWGSGTPAVGTTQEALSQYHKIGGPGDNGLVITDVLDWARTNGFVVSGQTYKIDGYVSVNWTNKLMVQVALDLFGSLKLGIGLPSDWMNSPKIWGPTNSSIIGGHDVPAFGYDETGVIIATWGGLRTITWDAFLSNQWVDEAYVPLPQAWYATANKSPNGVALDVLNADMNKINGGSIPDLDPVAPPWSWNDWS